MRALKTININRLTLREIYRSDRLVRLLPYLGGHNQFGVTGRELAEIFENSTILDRTTSERDRVYVANPNNRGGRFYTHQVQFLKSELRDYLFGNSSQIDVRNCNYSLLWSILCNLHDSPTMFSMIERVYESRDAFIDELSDELRATGWELDEGVSMHAHFKELLNAMVMGKSPNTWKSEVNFLGEVPSSLLTLERQLRDARRWCTQYELCRRFYPLDHESIDEFQLGVAVTFRVLQHLETYNMLVLISVLAARNITTTLWIFDAIEILGSYDGDDTDGFLGELRDELTMSGFDPFLRLRVVGKDFSRIETLLAEFDEFEAERVAQEAPPPLVDDDIAEAEVEQLSYYEQQRAIIQSWDGVDSKRIGLVKVMSPLRYFFRDMQGKHHALTRKELLDTFENYCEWTEKGSFILTWLKDHANATYSEAGIYPDRTQRSDQYNLYTGFDVEKWTLDDDDRSNSEFLALRDLYFEHLRSLVNNDEHFVWFDRWFAHMFQHPGKKVDVAGVWQSENEGNGKNLAETVIRTMLGDNMWFKTNDPDSEMFGTYNGKMENTFFGVLDESSVLKHASVEKFKNLISDTRISIRRMHTNHYESDDHNRFLLCTNVAQPVVISDSDRRFQISDSRTPKLERDRACAISSICTNHPVMRLIYEHYMAVEVPRDYDFARNRVLSERYMELKDKSVPHEVRFLHQYIRELYANPPSGSSPNWIQSLSSSSSMVMAAPPSTTVTRSLMELYRDYADYMKQCGLAESAVNRVVSIDFFGDRVIGTLHIPRNKYPISGEFSNVRGDASKNVDSECGIHYFLSNHRNKHYRKVIWYIDIARAVQFLDNKYPRL